MRVDDANARFKAVLEVEGDPDRVEWIYRAFLPETGAAPRYRSRAVARLAGEGKMIVEITSGDVSSLRAAFNTFARLLETVLSAERVEDI
jgi:tRNA threonylcarbamoyladenosine modification (KEOPS) complex  Pcc1 subunit